MDPVSMTLAVLPLAVKVGTSAYKVKDFLSTWSSAPKEVKLLAQKLDAIATLCSVVNAIPAVRSQGGAAASNATRATSEVLELCLERIEELERITSKLQKTKKSGVRLKISFAFGKAQIKETTQELDSLVNSLHFALNVNSIYMRASTTSTSPTDQPHSAVSNVPDTNAVQKPSTALLQVNKRNEKVQNLFRYYVDFLVGSVRLQRDRHSITFDDSPETTASNAREEETVDTFVSFRLPWPSYSIDCRYITSSFSPLQCSLTMTHHIDPKSDLFQEISWMLYHGDIDKFEELMSESKLSPYCQMKGLNLLQLSLLFAQPGFTKALTRYNINDKLRGEFSLLRKFDLELYYGGNMEFDTRLFERMTRWDSGLLHAVATSAVDTFVSWHEDELTVDEIEWLLERCNDDPRLLLHCLERLLPKAGELRYGLLEKTYRCVCRSSEWLEAGDCTIAALEAWASLLRRLTDLGLDIYFDKNIVDPMTNDENDDFHLSTVEARIVKWLRLLRFAGVDTTTYIRARASLPSTTNACICTTDVDCRWKNDVGQLTSGCSVRYLVFDGDAVPFLWNCTHLGPAYDVLREFEVLVNHQYRPRAYNDAWLHLPVDSHHTAWKKNFRPEEFWPFHSSYYTILGDRWDNGWDNVCLVRTDGVDYVECVPEPATYKQARLIEAARLERRLARREWKDGIRRPPYVMPGSWVA